MTTYTTGYKALQEQFHTEQPDYGVSGHKYSDAVLAVCAQIGSREVLDYGAGKCTLAKSLPFPITCYDPFIPALATYPRPHDLVVCTDVMEHVEEDHVVDVLIDIRNLCKKAVFLQIATRPARKVLPDGRNAHITLHDSIWWLEKVLRYFRPLSFQDIGGGFLFLGEKRNDQA